MGKGKNNWRRIKWHAKVERAEKTENESKS